MTFDVVDLFSGAGGMSFGFYKHQAFRVVAVTDAEVGKPSTGAGKLFDYYISKVDSIIQLPYFKKLEMYELLEFPVERFKGLTEVPIDYFKADGPTINIPIGQDPPDFTLKLDRSDAKTTMANINKDICTVHGIWRL